MPSIALSNLEGFWEVVMIEVLNDVNTEFTNLWELTSQETIVQKSKAYNGQSPDVCQSFAKRRHFTLGCS